MAKRKRSAGKPTAYIISQTAPTPAVGQEATVRAQGARTRHAERARIRILMCAVVFVFVFASLSVRLAFISLGKIEARTPLAAAPLAESKRPEIVDRRGALLAADLPLISLELAGREVWDPKETAEKLKTILPEIDAPSLEQKLRRGRYVEVRTDLTPAERQAVFDLGLPGVRFATRIKRFYPQADLAAHVIGHEEPGKGGVMGLERVANEMRGDGPMVAALDIRVQQIVEDELSAAMEKFQAKAAWAGVMDVHTGEIIALASLPDFDPNRPGAAPPDFRRNRAVYDRYELGSAFKAFTAAAALDSNVATEDSDYDAREPYRVADRRITDFHGENRVLRFSEVVQHSSNIGIARMAAELGAARQRAYYEKLGLLDRLPMALHENRAPEPPGQWGPVETATLAYGHGISVTPLHLLTAFAAVVNGGVFHNPAFLRTTDKHEGRRVFSPETSAVMRRVLRMVIVDGTAEYAEAQGYFPIGKTATADKPAAGGYDRNTRIASFVGAAPGYAPRYAVLVSLDEPQPLKETYGYATAGWNAAPTFSRIITRAAPLLGLSPVSEEDALAAFEAGEQRAFREARLQTPPSLERKP